MVVPAEQAVHTDAVAAMGDARTVEISPSTQVQSDVGAPPCCAEEDQVTGLQQPQIIDRHRHRGAEPFLLVGIPGDPDPSCCKCRLHQSGTVVIGPEGAPPEVSVGYLCRRQGKGDHPRQPRGDRRRIKQPGTMGAAGHRPGFQVSPVTPAPVAILEQFHELLLSPWWFRQQAQPPSGQGLGGESRAPSTTVQVEGSLQQTRADGHQVVYARHGKG